MTLITTSVSCCRHVFCCLESVATARAKSHGIQSVRSYMAYVSLRVLLPLYRSLPLEPANTMHHIRPRTKLGLRAQRTYKRSKGNVPIHHNDDDEKRGTSCSNSGYDQATNSAQFRLRHCNVTV